MPVSKKRKKDGKPAARKVAPPPEGAGPHAPEAKASPQPLQRAGRPSNPFVAQQQARRGAQRGR